MDEHRDEAMDDFDWRADLEQARASARDTAPIAATMYRGLREEGLDEIEASFLSAAGVWTYSIERPGEE